MKEEFEINFQVKDAEPSKFETIRNSYYEIWEEIEQNFSCFTMNYGKKKIGFDFNWEPIKKYYKENIENMPKNQKEFIKAVRKFDRMSEEESEEYILQQREKRKIKVKCIVELKSSDKSEFDDKPKQALRNHLSHHLEFYLENLFLLANISAPGSCNLKFKYKTGEYLGKPSERKNSFIVYDLYSAWERILSKELPEIKRIPLMKTWRWFKKLEINTRQVAKTNVERALFALLHFCHNEDLISSNSIIWLAHALESLYDTPRTSIRKSLKDRILMVLNIKSHKNKVKKGVNNFYDLRSRLVHGDFNITHPCMNDIFDNKVEEVGIKMGDNIEFILIIIIATLQRLILEEWNEIKFVEDYYGK